jgi:hypothetical protein
MSAKKFLDFKGMGSEHPEQHEWDDDRPLPPHKYDLVQCPICRTSTVFALFGLVLIGALISFAILLTDPRAHVANRGAANESTVYVNSAFGVINGRVVDNGAEAYLGIPYAEPPIGALRFAAPVAWTAGCVCASV